MNSNFINQFVEYLLGLVPHKPLVEYFQGLMPHKPSRSEKKAVSSLGSLYSTLVDKSVSRLGREGMANHQKRQIPW